MRINGFEQIKGFYSWVFDNQDKQIKPQHISLYIFMVNQNNRNNWVKWFKLPFDLAMTGSCISSKKTYYTCLTDLQKWKLISYEKGINNWKAPLIKLEVLKDTSTVPQSEPQQDLSSTTTVTATAPQPTPNIKPITSNNIEVRQDKQEEVLRFFGFSMIPQYINQQRMVMEFFKDRSKAGELDDFIIQFDAYRKYFSVEENKRYRHSMNNFLGSAESEFSNGKWKSENWTEKYIPEEEIKLYQPRLAGN